MGLRARLPLTSTPQRRPATLARQLQPATATQLDRRPATNQPRSQRPWVGQIVTTIGDSLRPCLAGTQHTPRTKRIMKGALSRRVALVAQQRARELGGVGAGDEDHEHTAVLGRDMAELEVLDVDGRGTQDLRDPRQHARAVGDADANAVQLPGLGLVRVREQLVAAALRIRDRALDERPVATLERTLDGFE